MSRTALARKLAKGAVLPAGLLMRRRPGDVVALLYHRVGAGDREIDVSAKTFERHLAFLSRNERVLTMDEMLSDGNGGVVVTIDDGYRDFTEIVVPLMSKYRLPAILYLATGLVANGGSNDASALTWNDLRDAVSTGLVTIGAHTHSHSDMSKATEETAWDEMRRCKDLIEDRLGVECSHFSYPWSLWSEPADRVARRLFKTSAVAWGTNRRGRMDAHRVARTPVLSADGPFFFRSKVKGMLDGEAWVYRALRRGPWRRG